MIISPKKAEGDEHAEAGEQKEKVEGNVPIAPPKTFVLSLGRLSSFCTERNWAAKASLTYLFEVKMRSCQFQIEKLRGGQKGEKAHVE